MPIQYTGSECPADNQRNLADIITSQNHFDIRGNLVALSPAQVAIISGHKSFTELIFDNQII
jgi:hypothetical protein